MDEIQKNKLHENIELSDIQVNANISAFTL